jgi:hypothetical protein
MTIGSVVLGVLGILVMIIGFQVLHRGATDYAVEHYVRRVLGSDAHFVDGKIVVLPTDWR